LDKRAAQIQELVAAGAERLLARATESYSVKAEDLSSRIKATLEKYLLKDSPQAPSREIADFIDQIQTDDLCLAIACEGGDAAAWDDLVARYGQTVRSAARVASPNEDAAEDIAQSIWAELHGLRARDDGRPASKLTYYSGRGSLAGWLRAVVAQLAVDQHRKQSRFVQTEDDAEFDRMIDADGSSRESMTGAGTTMTPEGTLTSSRQRVAMENALSQAISEMDDEDRLLVKLYYFDNLRLREAGAVLGVHEATASRRLTRVHLELRNRVEEILIDQCRWTKSETATAFSALGLHLESDIEMLVTQSGAESQTP